MPGLIGVQASALDTAVVTAVITATAAIVTTAIGTDTAEAFQYGWVIDRSIRLINSTQRVVG